MIIEPYDEAVCDPHAVVREEDVQLILTAAANPSPPTQSLDELERAALNAPSRSPGSVVVRPGRPMILLAVIHDLDREPSWREDWILAATVAALRAARWRGLMHLSMPLLGTVHGRLDPWRAAELLAEALVHDSLPRPETLWIEDVDAEPVAWLRDRIG
ncbi:MAG: hypothetical protein U5K33_09475 [Halofilum sp. (in: g-proteobacteria)]|nr:hypothetical protein [Halofilum sp. (in: g-proteobacteria)]